MSGKPGASIQRGRRSSAPKGVTIFISYSQKDDQWATRIHEALENNNITLWRDKSRIRAGEKISDSISSAINLANYVILLLSADSNSSGWVEKEINSVLRRELKDDRKILIPIKLDKSPIPRVLEDRAY